MVKSKFSRNKQHWKKETKTIHNQKKQFNPGRYGNVWSGIDFQHDWGRQPQGDSTQPIIGQLLLDGKKVSLTFTETNKIIETLRDAQHVYNVGVRLGRTNQDAGSMGVR